MGKAKLPNEDCKYGSNNGYDGVYIEGTIQNPTKISIGEAKQWDGVGGDMMNNANGALPIQMSDDWIDFVALQLKNSGVPNKVAIGNMIQNNRSIVEKFVTVVNKKTGDINIIKLGTY